MSDNKELLTIAVIAAALMMVLGTSIPSSVLAQEESGGIKAAEPTDDSGHDDSKDDSSNDNNSDDSSNDVSSSSKDDSESDGSGDSSGDNDSTDSNSNGGVPEEYLDEYSTCVSDLTSDDSILTQDDVVDCYGQVFGPNPTHDLGPLAQNSPSPATSMPGFESMPPALQQPGVGQQQMQPLSQSQPQDGQQFPAQQQQSYPAAGDQQQMQPLSQSQPQDGQQLPIQQQQQPQNGLGGQQQMSPTELPIDAGILDVETIKEMVKNRLAQ